jgi:hypothetical protein
MSYRLAGGEYGDKFAAVAPVSGKHCSQFSKFETYEIRNSQNSQWCWEFAGKREKLVHSFFLAKNGLEKHFSNFPVSTQLRVRDKLINEFNTGVFGQSFIVPLFPCSPKRAVPILHITNFFNSYLYMYWFTPLVCFDTIKYSWYK